MVVYEAAPKLIVIDRDPDIGPEIVALFQKVAANPRQKIGRCFIPRLNRSVGPLMLWDWRRVAYRYLRRALPGKWIYVGGRHIAIHASPPIISAMLAAGAEVFLPKRNAAKSKEAGKCLARIAEARFAIPN